MQHPTAVLRSINSLCKRGSNGLPRWFNTMCMHQDHLQEVSDPLSQDQDQLKKCIQDLKQRHTDTYTVHSKLAQLLVNQARRLPFSVKNQYLANTAIAHVPPCASNTQLGIPYLPKPLLSTECKTVAVQPAENEWGSQCVQLSIHTAQSPPTG